LIPRLKKANELDHETTKLRDDFTEKQKLGKQKAAYDKTEIGPGGILSRLHGPGKAESSKSKADKLKC
jgi:hypothetical protein